MSGRIVQPIGKVKLTNVAVVRYEFKGKRFEIACYKNKIVNWRNGIEKDIDEVLQIPSIFLNVSKGVTASNEDLQKCFGTTNTSVISKIIMEKGVEQISGKEREYQLQALNQEVATLISEMCYNPDTEAPYTVGMIQRAMKDAHISLHPTQSVKKQALDTIATLKTIMRIERMQMLVQFIYKKAKEAKVRAFCAEEGATIVKEEAVEYSVMLHCAIDPRSYKHAEELCKENPSINFSIISNKYVPEETKEEAAVRVVQGDSAAEQLAEANPPSQSDIPDYTTFKFKCSTCEVGFNVATEHREHFRCDWHRFNLKRKNKGLTTIREDEFNSLDEADRELFLRQDSIAT